LAVTQRIPDAIYELASIPRSVSTLMLSKPPVAGDPYASGIEATLVGLELPSPTGAWPASYDDPAITWRDHDSDGNPGITALAPTSGRSTSCNLDYGGLPIPASGAIAERLYVGSRLLASLDGTIVDCDTIRGNASGPASGGMPQLQGHVAGCVKTDGSACTTAEIKSIDDGLAGAQRVVGARFTMVRVPDSTSCAGVRARDFP
jgi:hypothetical protein